VRGKKKKKGGRDCLAVSEFELTTSYDWTIYVLLLSGFLLKARGLTVAYRITCNIFL